MKKLWLCAFSLIAVMILFTGCDKSNNPMVVDKPTVDGPSLYTVTPPASAYSTDIMAGQTIDVGDIFCWFDFDNLYVYYRTVAPWYLTEFHVQVELDPDDFPLSGGGAIPGQFEKKGILDPMVDEKLVTYPLTDDMKEAEQLCVAAHCVVAKVVENVIVETQTGWGEGPGFPGANWSMYFWVTVKKTLNLPTSPVSSRFTVISGGDIPSQMQLANVPDDYSIDDGYFPSFCLDHGIYIYNQWYYNTLLYTSYAYNMPDYAKYIRGTTIPVEYGSINWLLNQTEYGAPPPYTEAEIVALQHCFWYYRGNLLFTNLTDAEKAMVTAADGHKDFWPSVGQYMAVLLDNSSTVQLTFIVVDP